VRASNHKNDGTVSSREDIVTENQAEPGGVFNSSGHTVTLSGDSRVSSSDPDKGVRTNARRGQ
jgi:hypothetical protein